MKLCTFVVVVVFIVIFSHSFFGTKLVCLCDNKFVRKIAVYVCVCECVSVSFFFNLINYCSFLMSHLLMLKVDADVCANVDVVVV